MSTDLKDLDVVVLLQDVPDEGLIAGETGTIMLTHQNGVAFEVEFVRGPGHSIVATIERSLLLKLRHFKITPPVSQAAK